MVSLLAALLPYHCTECCNSDEAKPPIVEGYGDLPGIVQVEEPGLKDDLLAEAPLTATVVTEDSKPEVEGQTLSDQLSESGSDVVIEGHDDGSIVSDRSDISCSDVVIDGELSDTSPVSSPSKRNRRGAERKKKERSEPKGMILGAGDEEDGTVISGALGINIDNPGKIADFYDLGRSIGEGSFGAVFKATVRATDAVRAVKRIPLPKSGRDRELRLDFLKQEIRITKMMDHPSIVKLFEVFEDDKSVYMVMELCRDGDLEEHIQEGGLDELDAATVMQQILRGVAYMHNHRICHRDLKSENMLLVMRPVPKASKHPHSKFESAIRISDFGLSCTYADGQMLKRNCGTDSHKSPQVFAHNYNYKCDVWACGVIMYFLLSGSLPFEGRDAEEMQKKITNAKVTWCQEWMSRSGEAMNLARQLLHSNEGSRIEASQALKHKWFSKRVPRRRLAAVDEEILNSLRGFRKLNKFRKASLAVIASMLPEKVIRPGRDLFIYLDKDGDGEVTLTELREAMEDLKTNKPKDASRVSEDIFSGTKSVNKAPPKAAPQSIPEQPEADPSAKVAAKAASKSAAKPAAKPASKAAAKPAAKTAEKAEKAEKPAEKRAEKSAEKPVEKAPEKVPETSGEKAAPAPAEPAAPADAQRAMLRSQPSFQLDQEFPAFSYTEFIAATFDRSRHSTEAVCRAAFRCFDKDNSGQLEPAELVDGYLLGKLEPEEVEQIMEELDENGDGEIDFQEFLAMMQHQESPTMSPKSQPSAGHVLKDSK